MRRKRSGTQPAVVGLTVAIVALVVVSAVLGYAYSAAEGQISSLKESGQAYCSEVNSVIPRVYNSLVNTTLSLQGQIQSDNSIITSLNASKPVGYEGIVATLNGQVTQDLAIISEIQSYTTSVTPLSSPNTFCASLH